MVFVEHYCCRPYCGIAMPLFINLLTFAHINRSQNFMGIDLVVFVKNLLQTWRKMQFYDLSNCIGRPFSGSHIGNYIMVLLFLFTILRYSVHFERLPNFMEFECIVFEEIKFKHREKCHFDTSKIGLVGHIGFPIVV